MFLFGSAKVRLLKPAYPGYQMVIEVTSAKMVSTGGVVEVIVEVENRIVCKGELSFSDKGNKI